MGKKNSFVLFLEVVRVIIRDSFLILMILISTGFLGFAELAARYFPRIREIGAYWGDWFGWVGVNIILKFLLRYKVTINDQLGDAFDPRKPTIIIGNHADPPNVFFMLYMTWYMKHYYGVRGLNGFIPRDDLNPLLLWSLRGMGGIPIPRGQGDVAKQRLRQAMQHGKTNLVILYPDGTRPTKAKLLNSRRFGVPDGMDPTTYDEAHCYLLPWRHGGARAMAEELSDANVVICTLTSNTVPNGLPFQDVLTRPTQFTMDLHPGARDDLLDQASFNELWLRAASGVARAGRPPVKAKS